MPETASNARLIGGRYLAGAASLASRPAGPVDALDTQSGRAAQVRIVFVEPAWDEEALAEAVSHWCGLGLSEVCGVLDFGPDERGWFLVLPPSLGMPLERWRTARRPSPLDAARLTLGFGRLVERIAAAGFAPDAAALADLAVGPGPTPFVERPLLGRAGDVRPGSDPGGSRVLAAILLAVHAGKPEGELGRWVEDADAARHASLSECLDELERIAAALGTARAPGLDGELDGVFDEDDLRLAELLPADAPRGRAHRLAAAVGVLLALLAAASVLGVGRGGGSPAHATPTTVPPASVVHHAAGRPAKHAAPVPHRRHHKTTPVRRHVHRPAAHATRTVSPPPVPPAPPPPPPAPSGTHAEGGSAGGLPDPGGVTTLPPPA